MELLKGGDHADAVFGVSPFLARSLVCPLDSRHNGSFISRSAEDSQTILLGRVLSIYIFLGALLWMTEFFGAPSGCVHLRFYPDLDYI